MNRPWEKPKAPSLQKSTAAIRTDSVAAYGVCLCGKSHEMHQTCLQDSHAICRLSNGWILLAAADGVGSNARAEIGSALAVEAVVKYFQTYPGFFQDPDSVLILLRSAYQYACGIINQQALFEKRPIRDFGTTLHTAIFANGMVYYGHAGDGGILAMDQEGEYVSLTTPQKGDDLHSVVPLMAGPDYWEFGASAGPVQSVMLCTDGVYDKIYSKLRLNLDANNAIDRLLAGYFLSPYAFDYAKENIETIQQEIADSFRSAVPNTFYPRLARMIDQGQENAGGEKLLVEELRAGNHPLQKLQSITDDITVVAAIGLENTPEIRPVESYRGADLNAINQKVYQTLYGTTPPGSMEQT